MASTIRQLAAIASRRLLYRDEQAAVDRALELADKTTDEPAHDPLGALRAWCAEHGHRVLPGDEVDSTAAAAILGVTPQHLRNTRGRIPYHGSRRMRRYYLADLSRHLTSCPHR